MCALGREGGEELEDLDFQVDQNAL